LLTESVYKYYCILECVFWYKKLHLLNGKITTPTVKNLEKRYLNKS